jgi:hypothetical protein
MVALESESHDWDWEYRVEDICAVFLLASGKEGLHLHGRSLSVFCIYQIPML